MHARIKAKTSFTHGRTTVHEGQEAHFTKGDAAELVKAGLAEHIADATDEEEALLGEKMDDAPKNKMLKSSSLNKQEK